MSKFFIASLAFQHNIIYLNLEVLYGIPTVIKIVIENASYAKFAAATVGDQVISTC